MPQNSTKKSSVLRPRPPNKKSSGKSRSSKALTVRAPRPLAVSDQTTLVPLRTNFSMVATEIIQLDSSSTNALATGGEYVVNLNSLSVPWPFDNTHQPYGFDQLALFYRKYKVNKIELDITIGTYLSTGIPHSTTAFFQFRPPTASSTMTGVLNAFNNLAERNNMDYVHLESSTAAGMKRYRRVVDIGKLSGLTPDEFKANVEDWTGLFSGASPAKLCTMGMAFSSDTIIPVTAAMQVRLTYHGEAFERVDFAQS